MALADDQRQFSDRIGIRIPTGIFNDSLRAHEWNDDHEGGGGVDVDGIEIGIGLDATDRFVGGSELVGVGISQWEFVDTGTWNGREKEEAAGCGLWSWWW